MKLAIATGLRCEEMTRLRSRARLLTIRDRKHPREQRGNDGTILLKRMML